MRFGDIVLERYIMSWHDDIRHQLIGNLSNAQDNPVQQLNNALRLLSKHRSVLLQNTLIQKQGLIVHQGPFEGLEFIERSSEGCHVPKLLGCYEQPLHKYLYEIITKDYDTIVNVGCAEGYYAVGLARKMPNTQIHAYDLNPSAIDACKNLAMKNDVADQVFVEKEFKPSNFKSFINKKTLILCDIEGAEEQLLDPEVSPELAQMDILVEAHDDLKTNISQTLENRFSTTHTIKFIKDNGQRNLKGMPAWFFKLSHLDQLLAVWEWRSGPTPWLIMSPKETEVDKLNASS